MKTYFTTVPSPIRQLLGKKNEHENRTRRP